MAPWSVDTTLTIEAGVQVLAAPATSFDVRGTLLVNGTAADAADQLDLV
ncbi:MAG: hypothetical protein AAF628_05345 [Planctomycetota bacterium]